uniref:carnosine N-methyltransferase n=1 Tax=Spongospora subterranea TaxID=70186 RepID=A0A0H5QFW7_9EUKA|eukprot:CRZ00830.1 hypothetical protein [Spongospora subterranea]
MQELHKQTIHWKSVPEAHRALLPDFTSNQKRALDHVILNQRFIDVLTSNSASVFQSQIAQHNIDPASLSVSGANFEKMKSTLRQFVREWSKEGSDERKCSYDVIVATLKDLFPDVNGRSHIRVLSPGSGLGRLTWEIAQAGFQSEGNEFSYFMLLGSHFILNCVHQEMSPLILAPFVHQTTNVVSIEDRLRQFRIPDQFPSCTPITGSMSMTAGDFLEVYGEDTEGFDAVVTCFFIDTAHNVIEYVETISKILKRGGYWINLGPLLYHYNETDDLSVELSLHDLQRIIPAFGLEMIASSFPHECRYVSNARSMMQFVYQCAFFTCRKS